MTNAAADVGRAFDAVAPRYDRDVGANRVFEWMRTHARAAVTTRVPPGARLLDLGCGAGIDAVWFANRGYQVTAIDASVRMVQETLQRAQAAGVSDRLRATHLSIERVASLPPGRFGVIHAGLGPFNCVDLCAAVVGDLTARLDDNGLLVTTTMGRICPWEWLQYGPRGRFQRAFARLRKPGAWVPVADDRVWTRYYRPGELARLFAPAGLVTIERRGLGLLTSPRSGSVQGGWRRRRREMLLAVEDRVGTWPVLREAGDHFLLVLQKSKESPRP
jgi:SAM-dependent methyltransferase